MSYYNKMNFKTLLRKWHTVIGIAIAIPSLFLTITGLGLLQPNATKTALIASAGCPDGAWLGVTSTGIVGVTTLNSHCHFHSPPLRPFLVQHPPLILPWIMGQSHPPSVTVFVGPPFLVHLTVKYVASIVQPLA